MRHDAADDGALSWPLYCDCQPV